MANDLSEHDAVVLDGDLVGGRGLATMAWTYYHRRLAKAPHEQLWFWSRRQLEPLQASFREATLQGLRAREPARLWILKGTDGKWDYPPQLREVLSRYKIDVVASFRGIRVHLGSREPSAQTHP